MRKLLILFTISVALILASTAAYSQCSPDPQFTTPGIYPDTASNIPYAIATVQYSFTYTIVVPPDTNIGGFIVPIDSIGVDTMTGLPSGFYYVTDSESDYWRGDSTGCLLIEGMPQQADVGIHHLTVTVIAKAGGITAPYTITGYKLEIKDSVWASIPEQKHKSLMAFPNPADKELTITIDLDKLPGAQLRLINSLGQVAGRYETAPGQNRLQIETGDLEPGIYTIIYNDDVIRRDLRVMISH